MKKIFLIILSALFVTLSIAQQEFHVFPENHKNTPGTASGNGSLQTPWNLQTALKQSSKVVSGGDTIWLHEGVYNGRYNSSLNCTTPNKYITVSAYLNDRVILNGNVDSQEQHTLGIRGGQVIYKNFEITWLGDFNRDFRVNKFKGIAGINHLDGRNCKFINLKIYNNPGLGFGSWKSAGGSLITECFVFNNGVINEKGRGAGEGFYVQNKSEEERVIKNNIIFNNYYKGIEVWSAGRDANFEYVKNITLDNNVIFNSGLPANNYTVDNIIVASDDRNAINIAKNIKVTNNILYHNTNYLKNEVNGDAPSLTIGFYHKAPVENVLVDNNIILGRNNALRILYAKTITFKNNTVYTGYMNFTNSVLDLAKNKNWKFSNNTYYSKNTAGFRIHKTNYPFKEWKLKFNIDIDSQKKHISAFNLDNVLDITKSEYKTNSYRVVLFNKEAQDVIVDFSKYHIEKGSTYTITDVENLSTVLKSGSLAEDAKITVPMQAVNPSENKTLNNFGVFIVEFNTNKKTASNSTKDVKDAKEEKKESAFKRFFTWLF
ncbi:right-handed parallel beta-helix repeat-containing protein [Lacinutrix sp. C3R15]|uniref:right-handed parallel beta-helix repeat-containing protein n=1 Tax=Flavobacteriaceae TaxID=49546 RepID=UPI001C0878E5|nr:MULTISPECIES: right-handed parallel beta-helix repeat-containing protein [Flavobacteriaceae]MBU2939652.1 right-handed parallel beta-helix repeat-containing protein [Lacinutrix sp. C3R15]MDO6622967.1 right-handed parallel beta-helix repeat-containing protein [Oceanihabitans sp. 1_MG-2023]